MCVCLQGYWQVCHTSIATLLPSLDPHLTALGEKQEQEVSLVLWRRRNHSPCIPWPMSAAPLSGAIQQGHRQCTWCELVWHDHTHIEPKSSCSSGDNGCGHLQLCGYSLHGHQTWHG